MSIDPELLKLLAPAVIALITLFLALPKSLTAWEEHRLFHSSRRLTESDFAIKFLDALDDDPSIKRYAEELGYAALVGDHCLSHAQRKLLLSLPDSQQSVEIFRRNPDLLSVSCEKQDLVWKKSRLERWWFRLPEQLNWFVFYLLAVLAASYPLLYWNTTNPHTSMSSAMMMILLQVLAIIFFTPLAIGFLSLSIRIGQVKRFMTARAPATS